MKPGPTGLHAWLDVLVRLSRAPVVSIASIRGRARGAGSEFVLACDLRLASREKAVVDALGGPRAELYGDVHRAVADHRLDAPGGTNPPRLPCPAPQPVARAEAR